MAEDFNRLKRISRRLVHAPFQHPWEFRLEISGMAESLSRRTDGVSDFDLLVKDISYGSITIETEVIKAGGITLTFPVGTEPVTMTMTIRDFKTRPFYRWFRDEWVPLVVNPDGTFNLPTQYLKKVSRISLSDPKDIETWYMLPTKIGDVTESVEADGFLETPVTMIQFRSQGDTGTKATYQEFVEPKWAKQ